MIEDERKTMVMCSKDLTYLTFLLYTSYIIILYNHVSFNVCFPSRTNFDEVFQIIIIFKMFKENMQMDL